MKNDGSRPSLKLRKDHGRGNDREGSGNDGERDEDDGEKGGGLAHASLYALRPCSAQGLRRIAQGSLRFSISLRRKLRFAT